MQNPNKRGNSRYQPACCPLRSCRRAKCCMGDRDKSCLADESKQAVVSTRRRLAFEYVKAYGRLPFWSLPPFSSKPGKEKKPEFTRRVKQIDDEVRLMLKLCKFYKPIFKAAKET